LIFRNHIAGSPKTRRFAAFFLAVQDALDPIPDLFNRLNGLSGSGASKFKRNVLAKKQVILSHGNERAVVILTQPHSYLKEPLKYAALFKWFYRKHPKVYELLLNRADRYNAAIHRLEQLEKEGQVYLFRPEEKLLVSRLENNPQKTAQVYANAMALARNQLPHLQKWLNQESFS
jgi:hypothetical protein